MTTKGTDNRFRSLTVVGESGTPSTPASGDFKLYVADDGTFFLMDDTGATVDLTAGGFSDPMTTRGDIIVRNASNVTARLAKGSADTFLHSDGTDVGYAAVTDAMLSTSDITTNDASTSKHGFLKKLDNNAAHFMDGTGAWSTPSGSGGISSGTSNPGSPTDGDLFYRSDLDLLIRYRSSGTRWVCTCLHVQPFHGQTALMPQSSTFSWYTGLPSQFANIFVERVDIGTIVPSGSNSGGNIWTIDTLNETNDFGSFTTGSDGNAAVNHTLPNTGLVCATSVVYIELRVVKSGSAGNLYVMGGGIVYRNIVT